MLKLGISNAAEDVISPIIGEDVARFHPAGLEVVVRIPFQVLCSLVRTLRREISGEVLRGPLRNATPVRSSVEGQHVAPEGRRGAPK